MSSPVKVAAVHAAPVFLDRAATTTKAVSIVREAARAGAQLIAFPETYIPAFPVWAALWAPIENHDLFVLMAEQSVSMQGPEIAALQREARSLDVTISMGISESSPASVGLIWNSNVLIRPDGAIFESPPQAGTDVLRKADLGGRGRRGSQGCGYAGRTRRQPYLR
jgi:aliphatic nitrilase